MATKIRLQRHGRKKRPIYFIVVAHSTVTRDGKFIEKLGTYNPLTVPATIELKRDRALYWLTNGAEPTNTVDRILSFKGVKYLKHLMRGVKLGLFDEATALSKFESWNTSHEKLVADRELSHKNDKAAKRAAAQGPIKKIEATLAKKVAETTEEVATEEATEAPEEVVAETATEVVAETPAVEETPVVAETPAEETPAPEADAPASE
jgi:small subunit ribosomal protein S16